MERRYPSDVLDIFLNKVVNLSQEETLEKKLKTTESVIPFIVRYNPSLPEIGRIIHKYWSLLNLSKNDCVKEIFYSSKPIVAFNRPKNLQDFLVSSDLKSNRFAEFKSQRCNSKRCSHCNSIAHSQTFTSTSTGETFTMRHNTNCSSYIMRVLPESQKWLTFNLMISYNL